MKSFFKSFFKSLLLFLVLIGLGVLGFNKLFPDKAIDLKQIKDVVSLDQFTFGGGTPLEKAIHKSKRVNALIMGVENGNRSDTIMFVSFDPESSQTDIVSIPRDTYYYEVGHEDAANRKINATYGRDKEKGVVKAVEDLLGAPIHYYASVRYEGVKAIVDSIGGVEVNVPIRMKYSDPTDNPPLKINLQKGQQVLNGDKAIQFLRYRHGNMGKNGHYMGGYPDGDLGRIKAQQQFVTQAIHKILGLKLPVVLKAALPHVETNAGMAEILYYEDEIMKIAKEKIKTQTLPGEPGPLKFGKRELSFFKPDKAGIEKMVKDLYGVVEEEGTSGAAIEKE